MTELTKLGKFLRKLRIDNAELLRDMSQKLGVTISFLSAVENGKKNMPSEWVSIIARLYNLSDAQKNELDEAVADSETRLEVKFENMSFAQRKLTTTFARRIKSLDEDEQAAIRKILGGS